MISRNSGGGFFAAHWDWIVAAAGVVALVGGVVLFTMSGNGDPDENAANVVRDGAIFRKPAFCTGQRLPKSIGAAGLLMRSCDSPDSRPFCGTADASAQIPTGRTKPCSACSGKTVSATAGTLPSVPNPDMIRRDSVLKKY